MLKSAGNKTKNRQIDYQAKKLLHSKGNYKVKRQLTEWKKMFANDASDKGLTSRI